ncbi:hypothetical protein RhiTH_002186 [Rhizoctonia solani]
MEVFANSMKTDGVESRDDSSLPEIASAALQLALERNAVRLRRVEYESRELLVIARTLLLVLDGQMGGCEAPAFSSGKGFRGTNEAKPPLARLRFARPHPSP